jgi:hypothetical protein
MEKTSDAKGGLQPFARLLAGVRLGKLEECAGGMDNRHPRLDAGGGMRVSIGFLGMLRDQLGQKGLVVDLPDGAGVADFMDSIAPLMEQKAAWAWDRENRRFASRVVVTKKDASGAQAKFDPDVPFEDGEEILVFMPIAGG